MEIETGRKLIKERNFKDAEKYFLNLLNKGNKDINVFFFLAGFPNVAVAVQRAEHAERYAQPVGKRSLAPLKSKDDTLNENAACQKCSALKAASGAIVPVKNDVEGEDLDHRYHEPRNDLDDEAFPWHSHVLVPPGRFGRCPTRTK